MKVANIGPKPQKLIGTTPWYIFRTELILYLWARILERKLWSIFTLFSLDLSFRATFLARISTTRAISTWLETLIRRNLLSWLHFDYAQVFWIENHRDKQQNENRTLYNTKCINREYSRVPPDIRSIDRPCKHIVVDYTKIQQLLCVAIGLGSGDLIIDRWDTMAFIHVVLSASSKDCTGI